VFVTVLGDPASVAIVVKLDVDTFGIREAGNFARAVDDFSHARFLPAKAGTGEVAGGQDFSPAGEKSHRRDREFR
jgi:hypothetical protein